MTTVSNPRRPGKRLLAALAVIVLILIALAINTKVKFLFDLSSPDKTVWPTSQPTPPHHDVDPASLYGKPVPEVEALLGMTDAKSTIPLATPTLIAIPTDKPIDGRAENTLAVTAICITQFPSPLPTGYRVPIYFGVTPAEDFTGPVAAAATSDGKPYRTALEQATGCVPAVTDPAVYN
ncbi:hypothetical protein [Nocardia terpenica]|uniref:Uncharacterized protein n=1 Tax=Nocardia terpenica TaxID=455432 RepID=A0A6G9ZDM7_9NOCA|nr:hypothetical protein [Nocardia terpenica]QIS23612.1 hypothetical protein F6W96_40445 [Nocardia terpenica]